MRVRLSRIFPILDTTLFGLTPADTLKLHPYSHPLILHDGTFLSRLKQLPLARDIIRRKSSDDAVRDLGEPIRGQRQDGRASSRKADAQQAGLGLGRHGLENFRQARDEVLSVGLVHFVLHGEEDHVWIGRGGAQSSRE